MNTDKSADNGKWKKRMLFYNETDRVLNVISHESYGF